MHTIRTIITLLLPLSCLAIEAQSVVSLQQLYEMADHQSQQLKVSNTALLAAREAEAAAAGASLPEVNVSLSGSYAGDVTLMTRGFSTSGTTPVILAGLGPQQVANGRQSVPHWGNSFSLQATQVVYAGGAISAAKDMARIGRQQAELSVEQSRQDTRFIVTSQYLDLCLVYNQMEVVERNIELTRKLLHNMQTRYEQGVVLKTDITRYELQLENLNLTLRQLHDAARVTSHTLTTTLHMAPDTELRPDTAEVNRRIQSLDTLSTLQQWQQQALGNNLNLHAADLSTEQALTGVKLAKAATRPSVAIVAEDHLFGPYTNDLIPVDANVNTWFVGIGVKYRLSNLWTDRHKVKRSMIEAQLTRESSTLAHESVENAMMASHTNYVTAFTNVRTQEKQVQLAEENYTTTLNRYQNGLALLVDMLDASNTLLSAHTSLADARINLLFSYYKMKYTACQL